MTRRQDAAKLVKDGLSPSAVGQEMGVSGQTVRLYLLEQIAEGELDRTHIVRSIDAATKQAYEDNIESCAARDYWSMVNGTREADFEEHEFRLYLDCRNTLRGDMYMHISKLEVLLHEKIRKTLVPTDSAK